MKAFWSPATAYGLGLCFGASLIIGVVLGLVLPDSNWDRQHALCDKSVAALLHSHDLVEVVRSGFIVVRLECSIGTRLTKEDVTSDP